MSIPDLRPYLPTDLDAVYRICRLTGWRGEDATPHYADPLLLGHFYAAPYVVHAPQRCIVAGEGGVPAGYVLGTADSVAFRDWAEQAWLPESRRRYPLPGATETSPQAVLIRRIHAGYEVPAFAADYPGHLHIDLLPSLQGRGVGRRLMTAFLETLRVEGCPAVHLVVNTANTRAVRFYEAVGFHLIEGTPIHRAYGVRLR